MKTVDIVLSNSLVNTCSLFCLTDYVTVGRHSAQCGWCNTAAEYYRSVHECFTVDVLYIVIARNPSHILLQYN